MVRALVLLVVAIVASGCPRSREPRLVVSAAMSLSAPVAEVAERFRRDHPGSRLDLNLASSGALRQQVEAGAPVDVYLSASESHMDRLETQGRLLAGTRRVIASNELAVIVPVGGRTPVRGPADLVGPTVGRLVIGNPRTVPAGAYAAESLKSTGLWPKLEGRLVLAEHVRQAVEYVARGEVDAGFVYATDLRRAGGKVREAYRPDRGSYHAIRYCGAVMRGTRHEALARAFLDQVSGAAGQAALARHGFLPPAPGAAAPSPGSAASAPMPGGAASAPSSPPHQVP